MKEVVCPEGTTGLSLVFTPGYPQRKRPERAVERARQVSDLALDKNALAPLQHLQSATRVAFGEGARPRAPRGPATTQRRIFVRDQNTSAVSVTTDREDAIPPGDGPTLHHSAWPDSRTACPTKPTALFCQPLEVGLASEARSTTKSRRSRKDDDENEAPCEGGATKRSRPSIAQSAARELIVSTPPGRLQLYGNVLRDPTFVRVRSLYVHLRFRSGGCRRTTSSMAFTAPCRVGNSRWQSPSRKHAEKVFNI